eukprot:11619891-Ditylum_brightwellii.AAC.1
MHRSPQRARASAPLSWHEARRLPSCLALPQTARDIIVLPPERTDWRSGNACRSAHAQRAEREADERLARRERTGQR